jgi:ankyrin repeat protein
LASQNGHIKVVKHLLNHPKVDPSDIDNVGMKYIDLVTYFVAIRLASENGHIEVVKLLLNHPKVDASAKNNIGINLIEFLIHLQQFNLPHKMVILK